MSDQYGHKSLLLTKTYMEICYSIQYHVSEKHSLDKYGESNYTIMLKYCSTYCMCYSMHTVYYYCMYLTVLTMLLNTLDLVTVSSVASPFSNSYSDTPSCPYTLTHAISIIVTVPSLPNGSASTICRHSQTHRFESAIMMHD